ncbi:MAG: hypothetical protein AAGB22_04935 [Bacteroidota bacterium]
MNYIVPRSVVRVAALLLAWLGYAAPGLQAQTTLNFAGALQTIASGSGTASGSIVLSDGIGYTGGASASGGFTFMSRNGSGQISATQSGTLSYYHFGTTLGGEFQLDNVNLQVNVTNTFTLVMTGYLDGAAVSGSCRSP